MNYILGFGYVVLLLLAYGIFDHGYISDIVHSLRGQLLLGSLCLALLIFIKSRAFGLLTITISLFVTFMHFIPQPSFDLDKKANELHTKQINLRYSNSKIEQHLASFNKETWDLLVLFEFSDKHREMFAAVKPKFARFGYNEIEGFPMGIAIVSKHPIVYRQVVHIESPKAGYVHLKLLVNQKILNVVAVHPPSPRTPALWHRRNIVLEQISLLLNDIEGPWLVVGDLNTVPWSNYIAINKGKWCYKAFGHYHSWVATQRGPSALIGLPIDHCVTSPEMNIHTLQVTPFVGSDHLLLEHTLSF
ncbi:hypothetical protein PCIT_a4249 [Pseudoalteromonas citrea]|uniref:Endonuclease/exonuclease/phosphatase domain-containing protein n=2 Tax=Pseudoalteromonas citrea TaxID=43655 RepID=A0AAD4AIG0_9GAMM|nr:endonuclease/exonuclease/phosphatase family protein [Pseudoalteromonas citrea]KAF7771193.1 hypothetical protein PCIT_a4249 [Pseudoalteromonas citrea]